MAHAGSNVVLSHISFAIRIYVGIRQLNAPIPLDRRFIATEHRYQRPINRATTMLPTPNKSGNYNSITCLTA